MLPFQRVMIRGMNQLLLPRGYQRKKLNWYKYCGRITVMVACRYHERYAVVILGQIDRGDCPQTHPSIHDAYFWKGMRWLVDDHQKWLAARNHEAWQTPEDAVPMFELFREFGLPALTSFENDSPHQK